MCTQWVAVPSFLHADSEDRADAQADLSLRLAHMPFFCFCHALAKNFIKNSNFMSNWSLFSVIVAFPWCLHIVFTVFYYNT